MSPMPGVGLGHSTWTVSQTEAWGGTFTGVIEDLIDKLSDWTRLSPDTVKGILQTLAVLVVVLVVRHVVLRVIRRQVTDVRAHYLWRRSVNYTASVVAILLIASIWVGAFRNIGTFLGLLTAGVAIALTDPLTNLAGWLFIIARRPFDVGDRIEIDGQIGDVIDVRLFSTHLLECGNWVDADQSTGRVLMIPNGKVFKSTVANYTHGFQHIWDELPVLVTFESDWRRAKQLLTEIADTVAQPLSAGAQEQIRRAASRQMIFFTKLTPIVYTQVKDSGVLLTIRYLTLPRERRMSAQRIWEAILEAFGKESGIDFAYPTVRRYLNQLEGKPDARAKSPADMAVSPAPGSSSPPPPDPG